MTSTFKTLKAYRDKIEERMAIHAAILDAAPRGAMNLTADNAKTPEWHAARMSQRALLAEYRKVNRLLTTVYKADMARDIDRCMHVLDGQPTPEYQQGLLAAIRSEVAKRDGAREVTTPYYRVRWFGNGNAHLWFLRDDLVERANRMIAQHFGEVLGAGPDARKAA